jgi:hypothetical protein
MKGGTLLIPSGSDLRPDGKHLFVILNDPCKNGQHALVSISSIRDGQYHDPTCLIEAGEHEFIRIRSFVQYQMARIERTQHLINCVGGWTFIEKAAVSEALVDRMFAGAIDSDFTPRFVQEYLEALQR